jgi:Protein of unknown function (DUF3617)
MSKNLRRRGRGLAYNFDPKREFHSHQGADMRISRHVRVSTAATALLAVVGAQVVALADDKPAGEMWRLTTSMDMPGMTMPGRTMEMCLPKGKEQETLSKPQGPGMGGNCSVQDVKREGTKFSANIICTGQRPMQGTVESVFEADHAKTTMIVSMNGQQVTMKTDSQKIGTPCTPTTAPGAK